MRTLLYFTAFAGGFISLSLETVGFRALAPYFGYSIYVFGSLIGLILFALAVGYWAGGLLSAKKIKPQNFFLILLAAGFYLSMGGMVYEKLLQILARQDVISGTLASTFILWAFPMAALAAISPYLVGMRSENRSAGYSAGQISAAGTLGALAGTFLTSFYFLPVLGTHATFAGNAYATIIVAILWLLFSNQKWALVAIIVPLSTHFLPSMPLPANVVHAEESTYGLLEVVDLGNVIALRTDRRTGIVYSMLSKDGSLPPALLYNLFAVPVAVRNAKEGLLLGVGAGTLPHLHEILNPDLHLVGVEIDPKVVNISKNFFRLGDRKNIDPVVVEDARPFLIKHEKTYDIIEMDVFREEEIPFYLASKEFFELTKKRLNRNGMLMMNVYDPTRERSVEKVVANTVAVVYPETYIVPAGFGSFFIVGSIEPLDLAAATAFQDARLADLAAYFRENARKVMPSADIEVLTDDRAPLETLYASAVLDSPQ